MNTQPRSELVSVVIPVRNRARVVENTLASLAAQTVSPDRIVLVDNGSNDDTEATLRRWADRRTDTVVVCEPTPGAAAARNRGLMEVESPYVMFFDSDDIMPKRHIEEISAGLRADNLPQLAAFDAEIHTLGGKILRRPFLLGDAIFNHLFHAILATQRMVISTELCRAAGGWNIALPCWNDYEFGLRLLLHTEGKVNRIPLLEPVRIISREDSITGTDFTSKAGMWEKSLDTCEKELAGSDYTIYICYRRAILAGMYLREGHPELAAPLLDSISHRRRTMRVIARYVAAGGRGVAHIARLLK